jgi:hypothetical protein
VPSTGDGHSLLQFLLKSLRWGYCNAADIKASMRFPWLALSFFLVVTLQAVPPKEANLIMAIEAPIVANGRTIGSMKLPPGSTVEIISIETNGVMVSRGGGAPFMISKNALPPEAVPSPEPQPTSTPTPEASITATTVNPSTSDSMSDYPQ